MGGVDKGLQDFNGQPLARHALQRLQPQVGRTMVNANRHPDVYAAFGVPVVADASDDFAGPLAGLLAGLQHCATPWLASVPCDAPWFPTDLVQRLAAAATTAHAVAAVATTRDADGTAQPQPVFCLVQVALRDDLQAFIAAGGRRAGEWLRAHGAAQALFDGPGEYVAFFNANTLDDLARASASTRSAGQP